MIRTSYVAVIITIAATFGKAMAKTGLIMGPMNNAATLGLQGHRTGLDPLAHAKAIHFSGYASIFNRQVEG